MTEFDAAPNFTFNAVAAVPRSVLAPSKIENVQPDEAITVI